MNNQFFTWPQFNYFPKKLIQTREKLEQKWGKDKLIKVELSTWGWERLLDEVRDLQNDNDAIERYATKLKKRYLSVLSYQFLNIPKELQETVCKILIRRLERTILRNAWSQFQHDPKSEYIKKIITDGFQKGFNLLADNSFVDEFWKKVFEKGNPLLEASLEIVASKDAFSKMASKIGVMGNSKLQSMLAVETWKQGGRSTFLNESFDFFIEELTKLSIDEEGLVLDRYLKVLEINDYHKEVGDHILRTYGRPDGKDQRNNTTHSLWEQISPSSKAKYLQWLFTRYIDLALQGDPDRIEYWKRKVYDGIDDVVVDKALGVLVMFIKDYVIVEFMAKGNALYCYKANDYLSLIRPKVLVSTRKSRDDFKDQYLMVERIIHSGSWHFKADYLIRKIMRS